MWQSIYFHILEFNSNCEINLFQLEMMLFFEDLSLILKAMLLNLFFSPFSITSKSFYLFIDATITSSNRISVNFGVFPAFWSVSDNFGRNMNFARYEFWLLFPFLKLKYVVFSLKLGTILFLIFSFSLIFEPLPFSAISICFPRDWSHMYCLHLLE